MKAFLYKLQDGSDIILFLSSLTDDKRIRNQMSNHDEGGMPYEDFERVWSKGTITKVTKLDDVPENERDWLALVSTELEDVEMSARNFCDEMDEDNSIEMKRWNEV